MSELQTLLLLGFLRNVMTCIWISRGKPWKEREVAEASLFSFLWGSLATVILVPLFGPFTLTIGSILKIEHATVPLLSSIYWIEVALIIFFIELENNRVRLQEKYSNKLIHIATFLLYLLSMTAFIAWGYLTSI